VVSEGDRKGIDDVQMINGEGRAGQGRGVSFFAGSKVPGVRGREAGTGATESIGRRLETTVSYLHLAVV
jgi:hypothetical protein